MMSQIFLNSYSCNGVLEPGVWKNSRGKMVVEKMENFPSCIIYSSTEKFVFLKNLKAS